MGITEATSQKFRNMGFLCVALVVMIHMGLREELTSPTWLVAQLLKDGICRIAVPFFFLVSGFFLAAHCAETGWWGREVRKRVLSLVVPFYLWLLTFVGVVAVSSLLAWAVHCPLGTSVDQLRSMGWIQCLGLDLTDAPFLIPLWYVRCLFIFVLLSPLICKVVGKLGWGWLVVCFGAELGLDRLTPLVGNHFFEYGFSLSGLFYFSLGIFLRRNERPNLRKGAARIALVLGIVLLVTKAICFANAWPFQHVLRTMAIPLLLLGVWSVVPSAKLPTALTACVFPIYLMHYFSVPYVNNLQRILHLDQVSPYLQPTLNFLAGFFGSILVANLARKFFPRTATVFFGGR